MTDQHPYTPSLAEARGHYAASRVLSPLPSYRRAEAEFDRMIEVVRAEERERCAQIAESTKPIGHYNGFAQWGNDPHVRIAARIRDQDREKFYNETVTPLADEGPGRVG